MLYTLKHFTAESRPGIPCKLEFLSQLLIDVHVLILLLVLAQTSRAVEKSCYRVEVLKFVHPSALAKGVCLPRFPTKIAEHRLFFIAQPCVISQPSFQESS